MRVSFWIILEEVRHSCIRGYGEHVDWAQLVRQVCALSSAAFPQSSAYIDCKHDNTRACGPGVALSSLLNVGFWELVFLRFKLVLLKLLL